jgi:hypothetical protein
MGFNLPVLNRRRRLLGTATPIFSPATLFTLSEPGVWYDPSDLTTLFQDTAGTTPVTTPGQTVALALDKSKGLVLGPELASNGWGGFQCNVTSSGGNFTATATANNDSRALMQIPAVVGRTNRISVGIVSTASGTINVGYNETAISVSFTVATSLGAFSAGQTATFFVTATNTNINLVLRSTSLAIGQTFVYSPASVKELPGFHATQGTTASRPIYGINPVGGRRNLLTRTEEFDNAAWIKTNATITANSAVAPDGTTTADTFTATSASHTVYQSLTATATIYTASVYFKQGTDTAFEIQFNTASFALGVRLRYTFSTAATTVTLGGSPSNVSTNVVDVGSGWFRATISVLCTAATWFFDVHGITSGATSLVWGAQLETGSTATAYQRVTDQYNVTEAGVPSVSYLFFNGNNFSMATSTITPGVDKAQVFAGVRKLSDAAVGVVAELSAAAGTNRGAFVLLSPGSTGASGNFAFYSTGSLVVGSNATSATTLAPVSAVLTAIGDISGDLSSIRTNGVVGTNVTTDQGTGNYLAYPLYIGHRFNNPPTTPSSLFFSGHLYSLIVRFGPNLTSTFISATEAWVAGKTGIVIA